MSARAFRAPLALLLALVLSSGGSTARAQQDDAASGDWTLERFAARFALFHQAGLGLQSQAGPERHGRGTEEAWIFNPILYGRLRHDRIVTHDIYLPVDIVSAASVDALDAVSSASRENEAFDLEVFSTIEDGPDRRFTVHWGGHIEEPLRAVYFGLGTQIDLADDNAVLSISADGIVDIFDPVQFTGYDPGLDERTTLSINASLSQLLSPTTVVMLAYGLTGQVGTLETTWNSVPSEGADRIGDYFPERRLRHAVSLRLTQAIPDSRTFAATSYRFYADDFGILAHTADLTLTQYLGDELWLRAGYRFHTQTAAYFWTPLFQTTRRREEYRTADSDLAAFDAHELTGAVRWFYDRRGALTTSASWIELSYAHYLRTNDYSANVVSIGWGHQL